MRSKLVRSGEAEALTHLHSGFRRFAQVISKAVLPFTGQFVIVPEQVRALRGVENTVM